MPLVMMATVNVRTMSGTESLRRLHIRDYRGREAQGARWRRGRANGYRSDSLCTAAIYLTQPSVLLSPRTLNTSGPICGLLLIRDEYGPALRGSTKG